MSSEASCIYHRTHRLLRLRCQFCRRRSGRVSNHYAGSLLDASLHWLMNACPSDASNCRSRWANHAELAAAFSRIKIYVHQTRFYIDGYHFDASAAIHARTKRQRLSTCGTSRSQPSLRLFVRSTRMQRARGSSIFGGTRIAARSYRFCHHLRRI